MELDGFRKGSEGFGFRSPMRGDVDVEALGEKPVTLLPDRNVKRSHCKYYVLSKIARGCPQWWGRSGAEADSKAHIVPDESTGHHCGQKEIDTESTGPNFAIGARSS